MRWADVRRVRRVAKAACAGACLTAVAALGGCHPGLGRGGSGAPSSANGFIITERADSGPIAALAMHPPYLWAAGAPGLRRWNLGDGDYEEVAASDQPGGRALTTIAVDDEGTTWVASAFEVGRWVAAAGGALHYEGTGTPGAVTALAPRRPVRSEGVLAGGPGGLYRYDGRRWSVIEELRDTAVTSLTLDDDGRAVWIGTRGRGLYRAEGARVVPAPGGDAIVADEIFGIATTAAGTRVTAGNVGCEARLYALTLAGTLEFRAPAGIHAVALVARGKEALIVAGPPGREQAYALQPLAPGQPVPSGGIRFSPVVPEKGGRWAGVPIAEILPASVTAVAVGGGELYAGSAHLGVAQAAPGRPHLLDGAELVGDADRFSVACETAARCLVVTDGPHAWLTDGDRYQKASVGEAPGAAVVAIASDAQGSLYAISAEPSFKGLVITKRAAGQDDWRPANRIALELPAHGAPQASFAAISPTGTLWIGLRVAGGSGEAVGYGAVEVDLQTGLTVQHRPRREGEAAAVEALPLPADLTGILFADGATWFASLAGVSRFQEGQFRSWGESDGLPSELCWSVARGSDGTIWAATSEGLARWDGQTWHPAATATGAARGLATDDRGQLWVATSKGLRVLPPGTTDLSAASVVVAGDMRDLARDRFGRLWALSSSSIALIEERTSAAGQDRVSGAPGSKLTGGNLPP
jgi:hypothetical protein